MQLNVDLAGIYIHVPFCRQACHYCNFHFSTSLKLKQPLVAGIVKEIGMRTAYLENKTVGTIYFGGGTPSLLEAGEIGLIIDTIHKQHPVVPDPEITLEANPDDLTIQTLLELKNAGINRLSIGTQSFIDKDLKWMNRAHTAEQAIASIHQAHEAGFENISIDLIYGIPGQSDNEWRNNVEQAIQLGIPHLSCYALTIEPETALHHQIEKNQAAVPDDDQTAEQFEILMDMAEANGYAHYEISNFAKDAKYSRHNTAYWQGNWYEGIGPSAHSFNGKTRQWNVANNAFYIKSLEQDMLPFEEELLDERKRFNEFVMLGLRTMWGIDSNRCEKIFGAFFKSYLLKEAAHHIETEDLIFDGQILKLSRKGKLIADGIMSDLFFI